MRNALQQENREPFNGCRLSVQLNGLNVLTINEGDFIKDILSFIAREEKNQKSISNRKHMKGKQ